MPNPREGPVAPRQRYPGLIPGGDALGWAELGVQAGIGPFTTRDCPSGGEREPARARPVPNPKEGLVEARQR